jgi:hypothetical protein
MSYKKYFTTASLFFSLSFTSSAIFAETQTTINTDYGDLAEIIPMIIKYKQSLTNTTTVTNNTNKPILIPGIPSAPGKYPLDRWLLPGGPPPPAPYLPPLTCTYETCPIN